MEANDGDNSVEHQATVEKGLRMRIKRKNQTTMSKASETKSRDADEDVIRKNGEICLQQNNDTKMTRNNDPKMTQNNDPNMTHASENIDVKSVEPSLRPLHLNELTGKTSQKRKQRSSRNGNRRECETAAETVVEKCLVETENASKVGNDDEKKNKDFSSNLGFVEKCGRKRTALVLANHRQEIAVDEKNLPYNYQEVEKLAEELKRKGCQSDPIEDLQKKVNRSTTPNSSDVIEMDDDVPLKKLKSDKVCDNVMLSSCDIGTATCNIGVMTDPDCLGSCQPGTAVVLEGIVWSESDNGILVVNVTWRGKTYVGTLMDATRHHWASPRFSDDSPSLELDSRNQKTKRSTPVADATEGRRLRKCRRTTTSNNNNNNNKATVTQQQSPTVQPDIYGNNNGRLRGGRTIETPFESGTKAKRRKEDSDSSDETFYKCIAPDCSKKFKHISGLRYHHSHAHKRRSYGASKSSESNSGGGALKALSLSGDNLVPETCKAGRKTEASTASGTSDCDVVERVVLAFDRNVSHDVIATIDVNVNCDKITSQVCSEERGKAEKRNNDDCDDSDKKIADIATNDVWNTEKIGRDEPNADDTKNRMQMTMEYYRKSDDTVESECCRNIDGLGLRAAQVEPDADRKERKMISDENERTDDSSDLNVTPFPSYVFSRPTSKTPSEQMRCRLIEATSSSLDSVPAVRPQTLELTRLMQNGGQTKDKSPVSENNKRSLIENEARLQKADKEMRRNGGHNVGHQERGYNVVHDEGQNGDHPLKMGFFSDYRRSPFNTPPSNSPSSVSQNLMEVTTAFKMREETRNDLKPSSVNDRNQLERNLTPKEENSIKVLPGQGQAYLERIQAPQQRSGFPPANMVPYGYGIDPLSHMQLTALNPEYRSQYERWCTGQQCYRQMLQAQSERCKMAAVDEAKPVDMSAKSASAVMPNISNSSDKTKANSNSSDASKLPRSSSDGDENHRRIEKRRESSTASLFRHADEFDESMQKKSERDKKLTVKHETRTNENDEKTIEMSSRIDKNKSKHLDPSSFSSSYPVTVSNSVNKFKAMNDHHPSSVVNQDFTKMTLGSHDTGFPSFLGFGNSTGSSNDGGGIKSEYPDINGKYLLNNKKSLTTSVKSRDVIDQSTKEMNSTEKNKFHRLAEDRCNFTKDAIKGQDKPSLSSSSLSSGHCSPLTLRHLHTHHHTHVVGAAYPLYGSYSGLMSPVPPVVPVIPSSFIPK